MVAALLAGAARLAGGAAGARGTSSRMVRNTRTGRFAGSQQNLADASSGKKMFKQQEKVEKGLKKLRMTLKKKLDPIIKFTKKVANFLSKVSPAFKQQMSILKKAWLLFWRPMGDFLAKILRPLGILLLKVALWWYKKITSVLGTTGIQDPSEDEEGNAADLITRGLKAVADVVTRDSKKPKKDPLEDFNLGDKLKVWWEDFKWMLYRIKSTFQDAWYDTINAFKEKWSSFVTMLGAAWTEISTFFSGLGSKFKKYFGLIWDDLVKGWTEVFDGFKKQWGSIIKSLKTFFTDLWKKAKKVGVEIWDVVKSAFFVITDGIIAKGVEILKSLKDSFDTIWTKIKTVAQIAYDKLTSALATIWTKIKQAAKDWLFGAPKDVNDNPKTPGILATGKSFVGETGMYKLHAGETVLPAGESQRRFQGDNSSGAMNITNTFHLNATINSDIDISNLAKRLASLQEIELRRRVSY